MWTLKTSIWLLINFVHLRKLSVEHLTFHGILFENYLLLFNITVPSLHIASTLLVHGSTFKHVHTEPVVTLLTNLSMVCTRSLTVLPCWVAWLLGHKWGIFINLISLERRYQLSKLWLRVNFFGLGLTLKINWPRTLSKAITLERLHVDLTCFIRLLFVVIIGLMLRCMLSVHHFSAYPWLAVLNNLFITIQLWFM